MVIGGLVSGILILPFAGYVGLAVGNFLREKTDSSLLQAPYFTLGMLLGIILITGITGLLGASCGFLIATLLRILGFPRRTETK
jgi:hypothetical protein